MQHDVSLKTQTEDWTQIQKLTIQGPLPNCRGQHYIGLYVVNLGVLFMKIQDGCLLPKLSQPGQYDYGEMYNNERCHGSAEGGIR